MQQVLTAIFLTFIQFDLFQTTVFIQGYRSVEEQVVVVYSIHTTMTQDGAHVFVQLLTDLKRVVQFFKYCSLLFGQLIRMLWIYCGEVTTRHWIFNTIHHAGAFLKVDIVEHRTVLHLPLRMFVVEGSLHLELYHGNRLVHLSNLYPQSVVDLVVFWHELGTRIIGIRLHGKR